MKVKTLMQGPELEEGLCLISGTGVRGADRIDRLTMQMCVVSSPLPKVQVLTNQEQSQSQKMPHKACIGRPTEPNMLRSLFRWTPIGLLQASCISLADW